MTIRISGWAKLNDGTHSDGCRFKEGWLKLVRGQDTVPMMHAHKGFEDDVNMDALPIGVWDEIRVKKKGIWVSGIVLAGEPEVDRIINLIKIKAITGLSTGTVPTKKTRDYYSGEETFLKSVLEEVSVCTFPSQAIARIESWEEWKVDCLT